MMAAKLETKRKGYKSDVINLAILVFITSSLGVYLIATTVLIANDGVFYIERAQKLSSNPTGIIKAHAQDTYFLFLWPISLFLCSVTARQCILGYTLPRA